MESSTDLSESNTKRRRIMIISGDDDIIDQIQKLNDVASCKAIILDTSQEDIRISSRSSVTIETSHTRKSKDGVLTCIVCGATANGYNFDVISCESCKSFFRRNALRTPTPKCTRQGQCKITVQSRRRCSSCRLAKCFSSGMKRERIMIAEQKAETRRNNRDQSNSVDQLISQPSPLLSADNLTSILDQEFSLISECLQGKPLQAKKDLLSPEELQRVQAIEDLYQKRIELAHDGLPWDPSMYTTDFLRQLNSHSVPLIRLLTFFKQIPEFDGLNVDDKVTLIKFNLLPLLCINCTLSYRTESDVFVESDSDIPWDPAALQSVYGLDGYQDIRKIFDKFLHIAKYDQKIIQLALITFVLTKGFAVTDGQPILNDFRAVSRAQNYFTELLWKYLETVHGSKLAVQIFSKMIAYFMTYQLLQVKLGEIITRNVSTANTNDISPFMKALLHIS